MNLIWQAGAVIFVLSVGVELISARLAGNRLSRNLAGGAIGLNSIAAGIALGLAINVLSVGFLVIALYRILNCLRLMAGRLQPHYLRRACYHAAAKLALIQLVIGLAYYFWPAQFSTYWWLLGLALSQLIVAAAFWARFNTSLRQTEYRGSELKLSDGELPTLSVAIPAKNESASLEACLQSLIASDYPKLEILVLDESAGSKTGEIIRALAHDGVRFIIGQPPTSRWLAKNLAYDRLASEANGEIILFCGVDVRFSPAALRQLVGTFIADKREMMSVMPLNRQGKPLSLVQPMRYFWELTRPRRGLSRPVLSTCWLATEELIKKSGGFKAVAGGVVPERHFAAQAAKDDHYVFLRADKSLDIASVKPAAEQRGTAIRTRYPLLRKRLAWTAGLSVFSAIWLFGPFALIILVPIFGSSWTSEAAVVLAALAWLSIFGRILRLNFDAGRLAAAMFIGAVIFDIYLANLSMLKYEFGQVLWKGRDAVRPVMLPDKEAA